MNIEEFKKYNIVNFMKLFIWIKDIISENGFDASIIGRLQIIINTY